MGAFIFFKTLYVASDSLTTDSGAVISISMRLS